MIDARWAGWSNNLLTATVLLYAIAMLCYAMEYARARGEGRGTAERRRRTVVHAAADLDVADTRLELPPMVTTAEAGSGFGRAAGVRDWATW